MSNTYQYYPHILFLVATALLFAACSAPQKGLFAKKTAHEQYAFRITDAGLQGTALGNLWFAAAAKALTRPLTVTLPYRETGYFAAEKPDAAGYIFTARRGELVNIQVHVKPQVIAATGSWYKVVLPDSREGFIESSTLSAAPYSKRVIKNAERLLASPDSMAAAKTTIPSGAGISILGAYKDYHFVSYKTLNGWLKK